MAEIVRLLLAALMLVRLAAGNPRWRKSRAGR